MKSGNLNFLEPSGPLQACNGTDLPLFIVFSLVGDPEGKRRIGRPSRIWEDEIKMEVKEKDEMAWTGFIWHKIRRSVLSNVITIWLRNAQEILCQATEDI